MAHHRAHTQSAPRARTTNAHAQPTSRWMHNVKPIYNLLRKAAQGADVPLMNGGGGCPLGNRNRRSMVVVPLQPELALDGRRTLEELGCSERPRNDNACWILPPGASPLEGGVAGGVDEPNWVRHRSNMSNESDRSGDDGVRNAPQLKHLHLHICMSVAAEVCVEETCITRCALHRRLGEHEQARAPMQSAASPLGDRHLQLSPGEPGARRVSTQGIHCRAPEKTTTPRCLCIARQAPLRWPHQRK